MWLLHTTTLKLTFFASPKDVGKYAILSHVWGDNENTFQDLQRIHHQSLQNGTNPHDLVSEKVRMLCRIAKKHGFDFAWNDTCCIDKTNNTDLSEAINSMYRYYALSTVCYAYLADVDTPKSMTAIVFDKDHPFRHSKWFKRGWTLQELIAPKRLIFFSSSWQSFGTKYDLAGHISEFTHIPPEVLRLRIRCSDVSVACRMSWASQRVTTRPEDIAYCLMGIFNVHMPVMYGEGNNAFRRLQQLIWDSTDDCSLFVWGRQTHLKTALRSPSASPVSPTFPHHEEEFHDKSDLLLAPSPEAFGTEFSGNTLFTPANMDASSGPLQGIIPTSDTTSTPIFEPKPYGVKAQVPLIENPYDVPYSIALLSCHRAGGAVDIIGLLLFPIDDPHDPRRPLYRCGGIIPSTSTYARLICFSAHDVKKDLLRGVKWRSIHIANTPSPETISTVDQHTTLQYLSLSSTSPFRIATETLPVQRADTTTPTFAFHDVFPVISPTGRLMERPGNLLPLHVMFRSSSLPNEEILVTLGKCGDPPHFSDAHWAHATILHLGRVLVGHPEQQAHICRSHHIDGWEEDIDGRPSKSFKFSGKEGGIQWGVTITLSFSTCLFVEDGSTRVLHVQVSDS